LTTLKHSECTIPLLGDFIPGGGVGLSLGNWSSAPTRGRHRKVSLPITRSLLTTTKWHPACLWITLVQSPIMKINWRGLHSQVCAQQQVAYVNIIIYLTIERGQKILNERVKFATAQKGPGNNRENFKWAWCEMYIHAHSIDIYIYSYIIHISMAHTHARIQIWTGCILNCRHWLILAKKMAACAAKAWHIEATFSDCWGPSLACMQLARRPTGV
jgi:hypothetical protein